MADQTISEFYTLPAGLEPPEPGETTLIELAITSLDHAHLIAGSRPEGYTPLVLSLPPRGCAQSVDCGCCQRIPSGFYPIVSTFGKVDDHKNWEEGCHCMPWWQRCSKLVTRQRSVFNKTIKQVMTKDNILVSIRIMTVFEIDDGNDFIFHMGPGKLDMVLRSYLDEATRRMASTVPVASLYDMKGQDSEQIQDDMNNFFTGQATGVKILSLTVVSVDMPSDLTATLQQLASYTSQTNEAKGEQELRIQGLANNMAIDRLKQEANVENLKEKEKGETELVELTMSITDINSRSSKEVAATKAEYEEEVQKILNDAELEVADLNNQRDTVMRDMEARVAKENNELKAQAWMYARNRDLDKVMESAKNLAEAKQVVANVERDAEEVLAARRSHQQKIERLKVFEALALNPKLRIATSTEVTAGANLSFQRDDLDKVVQGGMQWAKRKLEAPSQYSW